MLIEVSIRELHNDMIKPSSEPQKVLSSDTTLCSFILLHSGMVVVTISICGHKQMSQFKAPDKFRMLDSSGTEGYGINFHSNVYVSSGTELKNHPTV
eukprot:6767565-Ditylum_brightwellii.AAC.1